MKDYIENVIAPKLQGDGGWIDFISFGDGVLEVSFQGECSKCLILDRCLDWIRQQVKNDMNCDIVIKAVRNRPFFWNN